MEFTQMLNSLNLYSQSGLISSRTINLKEQRMNLLKYLEDNLQCSINWKVYVMMKYTI
jgi:hypothetical protein